MKNVGEAFAFYIRYCPEMDALYADEEYDLIPDSKKNVRDEIEEKVLKIGNMASEQAASLLMKVSELFITALDGKAEYYVSSKPSTVIDYWYFEGPVRPENKKNKDGYMLGANIVYLEGKVEFFIWSWSKKYYSDPEKAAQRYKRFFPHAIFPHPELSNKSIAWASMPVTLNSRAGDYFVDEDELLKFAKETIEKFVKHVYPDYIANFPEK